MLFKRDISEVYLSFPYKLRLKCVIYRAHNYTFVNAS